MPAAVAARQTPALPTLPTCSRFMSLLTQSLLACTTSSHSLMRCRGAMAGQRMLVSACGWQGSRQTRRSPRVVYQHSWVQALAFHAISMPPKAFLPCTHAVAPAPPPPAQTPAGCPRCRSGRTEQKPRCAAKGMGRTLAIEMRAAVRAACGADRQRRRPLMLCTPRPPRTCRLDWHVSSRSSSGSSPPWATMPACSRVCAGTRQ